MLKSRFFVLVLLLMFTSVAAAQSGAGGSDFTTRCVQPGVIRCVGFDNSADINGEDGSNSGIFASSGNANVFPTLDTTIKASGNSSLRFTIPAHSGADTSGSYFVNFSPDLSVQFGENSEFYIQWRQRFTPEFVTTQYAGGEGWIQTIIGTGDQPGGIVYSWCTDLEVVTLNGFYRGFAQMYNSCSGSASHGALDDFEELFGSFDFKLQNARPAPYCLYSQTSTTPSTAFPPTGNCIGYFPNEWMTFQVHIKTGPRVGDEFRDSLVELWIAREGQPSELAISWGPYNLSAGSLGENQEFGKVWLLPYNTDKDSSVRYPRTYIWYDELIISRTRIADPGFASGSSSIDTTPPSALSGLQATAATSASATTLAQATDTGLVAAYTFNEGAGTTLGDSSGKGNVGHLINSPVWMTGQYGGGLAFDGLNDYVTIPNTAAIDIAGRALTVELWVNVQTGGRTTDYVILNKPWFANSMAAPYYQYGIEFGGANREFVFYLGTAAGEHSYSMGAGASYGLWYHVAFTYDGANVRGYLNGLLQFTTPETLTMVARGTDLRFGVDGSFEQPFKGRLDDVRLYARALTQTEIQNDMRTPVGGGTSGGGSAGGGTPPADTQAPAVPTGLTVTAVSAAQVNLAWNAATDNVGVTGYQVYRCQGSSCIPNTQVTTVTGTSYQDTGLTSGTVYIYQVAAQDAAGNVSAPSLSASATTQASSPPPTGTSLSTLAASLQPGQWRELTTTNIIPTLDNLDGANGMLTAYTDDLVWDPIRQQAFLIGADHLAPQGPQFVSYTTANNSWQRLPRPAWLSSIVFFHGYDHSAIDQARGILYHRPFNQNVVHRYDIASQIWTQLPTPNFENTTANCCDALEFFPELDGLVWVRGAIGEVWLFKVSTQQWSRLGTWPTHDSGTWTFAEYNPVHKLLMFGSGNENTLFRLSSSGQITQLRNPPISIYDGSGYVGAFTVDPVSGTYLLLTPTSRQLYTYDVNTDTWQLWSSPTQPDMRSTGVVATPVSSYGVNLFVACTRGDCHAYVYKHGG